LVVVEHSTRDSFLLDLGTGISARLNLRNEVGIDADTGDERRTVVVTGADMRRIKRMSERDVKELARG
jgi:hypothetical protein